MNSNFVDNWLHPLGQSDSDVGLVWRLASSLCADATGRRSVSTERQDKCRNLVKSRLKVSDSMFVLARNNQDVYAQLVSRFAQEHTDSLNEVLGDTWNVE